MHAVIRNFHVHYFLEEERQDDSTQAANRGSSDVIILQYLYDYIHIVFTPEGEIYSPNTGLTLQPCGRSRTDAAINPKSTA